MEEGEKEEKKEQRNERKPGDYVMEVKLAAIGCGVFACSKHNRCLLCCGINEKT